MLFGRIDLRNVLANKIKMRLRVREHDKVHVITDLTETSTFLELKRSIQALTGIPPLNQEIKTGYPPRVCEANDHDTLVSLGLRDGEVIILCEISPSGSSNQPVGQLILNSSSKESSITTPVSQPKESIIATPVENGFVVLRASPEFDQTIFDVSDDAILMAATEIANKMKQMHKYTYTADFTLRCDQCKKGLKGDKEAIQHAQETGRYSHLLLNRSVLVKLIL
ncbi:15937_t:CDS:2 [Acaulospora colombiana]|uniref:15937_t:CDS:1 n=1 Tax=Acaulospora colombiana TaxID=27376 RepID=A0ACA9LFN2_9GLOM|nr:15937_t:CDS:2 [Acaulospora colombiana]